MSYTLKKSKQARHWLFTKIALFKQFKSRVIAKNTTENYLKHKNEAYNLALKRAEYFNKIYHFRFNKITIKNQKTRWGSCSRQGNLNFNYKIALLPQRLSDYIIVHELAHLKAFNHSRQFWNLVEKVLPDYVEIRSELKQSGINFY